MLRFAVCDDEPYMIQELLNHLADYMEEKRMAYSAAGFTNGPALLESGGFDVIFLDIQMEAPDGMETARQLRRRGDQSLLVFVTVLRERALEAFQAEAYDYLLKPLDSRRFRRTMDRALKMPGLRAAENLVIRRGNGCEVVLLSEIVYCEVLGRKIYIHKSGGSVSGYYSRMEDLEKCLDSRFFRCHRSYLVNLDHVRGCRDGQVLLPEGGAIPVSRLRERTLTEALLRHMKERDF